MRFFDKVGFSCTDVETSPGVWESPIEERRYYGDVIEDSRRWERGESINDTPIVTNVISINADAYAFSHLDAIRYVWFNGCRWKVTSMKIDRPRIKLTLGGVYANEQV